MLQDTQDRSALAPQQNEAGRTSPLTSAVRPAALMPIVPGPGLSVRQQIHERWMGAQMRMKHKTPHVLYRSRKGARIVYGNPIGPKPPAIGKVVYFGLVGPPVMCFRGEQIRGIKAVTCAEHNVSLSEVMGQCRKANIALARQHCMYRLKQLPNSSFPQVGNWMGGRDHTTVLHAVRKIQGLIDRGELQP